MDGVPEQGYHLLATATAIETDTDIGIGSEKSCDLKSPSINTEAILTYSPHIPDDRIVAVSLNARGREADPTDSIAGV